MAIHLVAGMARGGTNLIWTSLASADNFYITRQEVNELLSTKNLSLYQKLYLESICLPRWYLHKFSKSSFLNINSAKNLNSAIIQVIQKELDSWLKLNYTNPPFLSIADIISQSDSTYVGLKMVSSWPGSLTYGLLQRNNPLKYIVFLSELLKVQHISVVVRHPFAQVEAWMRRGASEKLSFQYYNRYINYFMSLPYNMPHTKFSFIALERFLDDPIHAASTLSKNINPSSKPLSSIRVAKRPTINHGYINVTDKISQLYDESSIQCGIQRDIEEQHIARFQGNKNSFDALECIDKYNHFMQTLCSV